MFFNHEKPHSSWLVFCSGRMCGRPRGRATLGCLQSLCAQGLGWHLQELVCKQCKNAFLTRSYLAAGPRLVKETESGLQLPSACQGSQAEQKDAARQTWMCVSLADEENALSLSHSLSILKNLCLLRDLSAARHPQMRKD